MDSLTPHGGFCAVPAGAPLAMPTQSLRVAPRRGPCPTSSPRSIIGRRMLVLGGAIALTGLGLWQMEKVLAVNGVTSLAIFLLVLFGCLFPWIALSFTSALAGLFSLLSGGGSWPTDDAGTRPATRTALLMPCYNESPARVTAGLQAIWESLRDANADDAFDIFLLSDTTDPDTWVAEEAAFLALRQRTGSPRIFYRRRGKNVARKSGNIADWVTRWGRAYPQFLILDADSVMQAGTLLRLVVAMETHPGIGLIQTLPIITGGSTLFARLQQFASRVYGPLIAHGLAWWQGAEGNYWGHNAVIRTCAFAAHAGLPELPGRKPFGGAILSHDFIEAALLRRAGWAIHMVPALAGSYEESPPNLIDLAVRDRRWCQGNLQHIALLPTRGLHWVSRLHLLGGIASYLTSPLWLLFLLASILITLQARFALPDYFPAVGKSLFPVWPVIDPVRAMWMFVATMGLLLAPKLLGVLVVLTHGTERRDCGGGLRLLASLLLETLISGLLAPVVMLTQSAGVLAIFAGRDSGWTPQRRDDGTLSLRESFRRYRGHTILGLVVGCAAWLVSPSLALWMSPVVLGLALAIPLALWTARRGSFARLGLLRIPEEVQIPAVLARATSLTRDFASGEQTAPVLPDRLLRDPLLLAAHLSMLVPPRRPWNDPLEIPLLTGCAKLTEAPDLTMAWTAMSRDERLSCLTNAKALELIIVRSKEGSAPASPN